MSFRCNKCSYVTTRAYDLRRHERRKTPCRRNGMNFDTIRISTELYQNGQVEGQNGQVEGQNGQVEGQNGLVEGQNGLVEGQNGQVEGQNGQVQREHFCLQCKKQFSCGKTYNRHLKICRGVESHVCSVCLKHFSSRKTRALHMRTVKCSPPEQARSSSQDTHSININTANIDNSQNVNIHINFGQEALEKLCAEPDYLKRMEEVVRLGKYALPQHISDIYFNDYFPMNKTIQKARHNDRFVKIKTGENKWDLRAVDDVYTSITRRMESYMSPYFLHVENQMEKIYDEDQVKFKRLTKSIREFGHKVLWLDWRCDDIRQIGVELNDPYCENERARRIQEMKSLLLEHIYDKTREMLSLQ